MWCVIRPSPDDIEHHGVRGQEHGKRRWQNKDGSLTPAGRIHYGIGKARNKVFGKKDSDKSNKTDSNKSDSETSGSAKTSSTDTKKESSKESYTSKKNDTSSAKKQESPKKEDTKTTAQAKPKLSEDDKAFISKKESEALKSGSSFTSNLSNIVGKMADKETNKVKARMDLSDLSNSELQEYISRMNLERQYKDIVASNYSAGKRNLQSTLEIAGSILAVGASAAAIASSIHEIRKKRG